MNKQRLLTILGKTLIWIVTVLSALSMLDAGYGKFKNGNGNVQVYLIQLSKPFFPGREGLH